MQRSSSTGLATRNEKVSKLFALESREVYLGCQSLVSFVETEVRKGGYDAKKNTQLAAMMEKAKSVVMHCKNIMVVIERSLKEIEPQENESLSRTSISRQVAKASIAVRSSVRKVNKFSVALQHSVTALVRTTTQCAKGLQVVDSDVVDRLHQVLQEIRAEIREILVASENWKLIDTEQTDERQLSTSNCIRLAKSAASKVQTMIQCAKQRVEQARFVESVKQALTQLNLLVRFAAQMQLAEDEQNLRDLSYLLLTSAKETYHAKNGQLSDPPLSSVSESIAAGIKQLLVNAKAAKPGSSFSLKRGSLSGSPLPSDKSEAILEDKSSLLANATSSIPSSPPPSGSKSRVSRNSTREELETNIKRMSRHDLEYHLLSKEQLVELNAALVLQSRIRSWSACNKLRVAVQHALHDLKRQQKMRSNALEELVDSEISYYQQLSNFSKMYLQPLKERSPSFSRLHESKVLQRLVDSVNAAIKLSKNILQQFKQRLDGWKEGLRFWHTLLVLLLVHNFYIFSTEDPTTHILGDIFMKTAPLLEQYSTWTQHFSAANQYIVREKYNEPQLDQLFKELREGANGVSVETFLELPSKRMPHYEVLLDSLLRYTPDNHADHSNLRKALKIIKQINDEINEKKREEENKVRLDEVQRCIVSKTPMDLVKPSRLLLREGPLNDASSKRGIFSKKKQTFYYFMFNDLIVKTKPESKAKRRAFHFVEFIYFEKIKICDVPDSNDSLNTFQLVCEESGGLKKVHNCVCLSEEEKKSWMNDLTDAQIIQTTMNLMKDEK